MPNFRLKRRFTSKKARIPFSLYITRTSSKLTFVRDWYEGTTVKLCPITFQTASMIQITFSVPTCILTFFSLTNSGLRKGIKYMKSNEINNWNIFDIYNLIFNWKKQTSVWRWLKIYFDILHCRLYSFGLPRLQCKLQ